MFVLLFLVGVVAAIVAGLWPAIGHRRSGGTPVGTWFVIFIGQLIAGELLVFLLTLPFAADAALAGAQPFLMLYALPLILFVSLVSAALVLSGVKPEDDWR